MPINWSGVALYLVILGALAMALTLWSFHVRRQPNRRMTRGMSRFMDLLHNLADLQASMMYAIVAFIALWLLLSWCSRAFVFGKFWPIYVTRTPWDRLVGAHRLRPWNFVGMGAALLALAAGFYRHFRRPIRIISTSLRRACTVLNLSLKSHATAFVADWRAKYLDASGGNPLGSLTNLDDLTFIANRCWALVRQGDPSKILVVSYGAYPAQTRAEVGNVVWVCLYAHKDGRDRVPSSEARHALTERNFAISDLSGYVRIGEMRRCGTFGGPPVEEATAPDRIIDLWRSVEPTVPDRARAPD